MNIRAAVLTLLAFVTGIVLGAVVLRFAAWVARRRDARRYPDALTRAAEDRVREAGYGRDRLGRPIHEKKS